MRLLFATSNRGKLRELRARVQGLDVLSTARTSRRCRRWRRTRTRSRATPDEGAGAARATGLWTLADDSGLCVDALGGGPGCTRRATCPGATRDRVQELLGELERVPDAERGGGVSLRARLASPERGRCGSTRGECRGSILRAPRGTGGFGYDPVFFVPELGRTMAELSLEEKSRVSHRARALDALEPLLGAVPMRRS